MDNNKIIRLYDEFLKKRRKEHNLNTGEMTYKFGIWELEELKSRIKEL